MRLIVVRTSFFNKIASWVPADKVSFVFVSPMANKLVLQYHIILPYTLYCRRPLWSFSVGKRPAAGFVRASRAFGK